MIKTYVDKHGYFYEEIGEGSSYEMNNGHPQTYPCRLLKDLRTNKYISVPEVLIGIQFSRVFPEINPMTSQEAFLVVFNKLKNFFENISVEEYNQSYKDHEAVNTAVVDGFLSMYYPDKVVSDDFKNELRKLLGYVWMSFRIIEKNKNKPPEES